MAGRNLDDIDCEIREVHGRTFRKLGSLLIEIVDRKLFQLKGFSNVEDYFNSEGHLPSARQAFRLISATRFSRQLPDSLPQPKSERQVRPLLGRPIEEAKLLWAMTTIVAQERNCSVDGKLVAKVVKDYQDGKIARYVPLAEVLIDAKNSENHGQHGVGNAIPLGIPSRTRRRGATGRSGTGQSSNALQTRGKRGLAKWGSSGMESNTDDQEYMGDGRRWGARGSNGTGRMGRSTKHHMRTRASRHKPKEEEGEEEEGRVLAMVGQISSLISNLAHAWGFMDIASGVDMPADYCTPSGMHNNDSQEVFGEGLRNESEAGMATRESGRPRGRASTSSPELGSEDHDTRLGELLEKTLVQLMMLVHRMGDPSCMWAMWAPGWGGDRNYWAMMPEQQQQQQEQQWYEPYGVSSSCDGDGVAAPSGYQSPMMANGMMQAPGLGISPSMMACPGGPAPKWPMDYDDGEMPISAREHRSDVRHTGGRQEYEEQPQRQGWPANGINGMPEAHVSVGLSHHDERLVTKLEQLSPLKRLPDSGSPSPKRARAARRGAAHEEGVRFDGEDGSEADVGPSSMNEIDEMAVAEALLCMSAQPPK